MSKTKNEMATLYGIDVGNLVDIRASVLKIGVAMADVEVFYNLAKPPVVVEVPIASLTRVEADGWPSQVGEVMEQRDKAEAQVAEREAEIRRLLDLIDTARDKLNEVIA